MELKTMKLKDIHPYPGNPRVNDGAVEAVMESIRQCTPCNPIIVDETGTILAGHTRLKAYKRLGYEEIEVVVKTGLTDEQKRKYRLLDNKTAELADWDFDLLADELADLDFGALDLDWNLPSDDDQESADEADEGNFERANFTYKPQYGVTVVLANEAEQEECYNRLSEMGYNCRVVTV